MQQEKEQGREVEQEARVGARHGPLSDSAAVANDEVAPTSRLILTALRRCVAHLDIVVLDRRTAAARVGSKERRDVLLSEKIERARNQHRGAHLQIMS